MNIVPYSRFVQNYESFLTFLNNIDDNENNSLNFKIIETAKDKLWTNRSRDQSRLDTKQRAGVFFYEKSSIFPLHLSQKSYFFYHKPTLVTCLHLFKNYVYRIIDLSECKLSKITMVQVCIKGKSFSATIFKYGSKTTYHNQLHVHVA